MEGWKFIYKVLLAVVLVYALYNVYIISNLRHSEEEEKLKKSQELLQSELGQIESHLRQLETNQNEFSSVVKDVQQYIQQVKKLPRPSVKAPVVQPEKILNEDPVAKVPQQKKIKTPDVIPILVIACNRPTVSRALDSILNARNHFKTSEFPILVSQDCGDQRTLNVIKGYSSNHEDLQYTEQLDRTEFTSVKLSMRGYYKLSRHYKFALSSVFNLFPKSPAVIIVEDDLEVSPDILSYFRRMSELLFDPTENMFCVSAWNDNGKDHQIIPDPTLVHRTDFFGGLGWMLRRDIWEDEWAQKWPEAFWDDWVRHPDQRRDRQCIHPEVPRTSTFGKVGVSNGQFFDQHLAKIHESHAWVDWSKIDIAPLRHQAYDAHFLQKIGALPHVPASDISRINAEFLTSFEPEPEAVVIVYKTKNEFVAAARKLLIMDDLKAGVPRGGYRGVVSTLYNNVLVYLAPPSPKAWKYPTSW